MMHGNDCDNTLIIWINIFMMIMVVSITVMSGLISCSNPEFNEDY